MNRILLFFTLCFFVASCGSNSNETNTQKKEEQTNQKKDDQTNQKTETSAEFDIVGKWIMYEDVDRKGLSDERGTIIFKENGELIFIKDDENQDNGKYEFSLKFKTLTLDEELVDIEIIDKNNLLLKGKHESGNKWVSQLVRQ
jgi:hypothetical protein